MIWAVLAGIAAAGTVLVWWLRRRYLIVTVLGRSMLPTYADGDRVLVRRRRSGRRVRVGDVVVARLSYRLVTIEARSLAEPRETGPRAFPASASPVLPMSERVVKRVAAGPGDQVPAGVAAHNSHVPVGSFVLLGDNPAESSDSRHYGYIPTDLVIGVVLRHLR